MNYDSIFFCKYCRKPKPMEGSVLSHDRPFNRRCATCEAARVPPGKKVKSSLTKQTNSGKM